MAFKVLTDSDVSQLADMASIVSILEDALLAKKRGDLICPPRHAVGFGDQGSLVFTTGGIAGKEPLAGFRVYDTFGGDSPDSAELVAVWDISNSALKGIIVGELLGAVRTGAIGGVAVKHMSRQDATTVAVIGAGLQARTQLQATAAVRTITEVKVFSRSAENRTKFAQQMSTMLGLKVNSTKSIREAVDGADIVLCATTSPDPVLTSEWLAPGAHVNTVGPKFKGAHELGLDVAEKAAVIATDSPEQVAAYSSPFFLAGTFDMTRMVDLAQLVIAEVPARTTSSGITLFCSVGLAGTEVLVADLLLKS